MSEALKDIEKDFAKQFRFSGLITKQDLKNEVYPKLIDNNRTAILEAVVSTLKDRNSQQELIDKLGQVVNNPAAVEEIINKQNSKSGGGQTNATGKNADNLGAPATTPDGAVAIANTKPLTSEEEYNIKKFTEQFPNNLPPQEVLKKIDEYGIKPLLDKNFENERRNYMGLAPNPASASNMNPEFEKISVQNFKEKFPVLAKGLSDKQIAYGISVSPKESLLFTALQNELKDFNSKLKPTAPTQSPILEVAKGLNLNRTASIAMHYAKLSNGDINQKDKSLYAQSLVEASKIKAIISASGGGSLTLNDYLSVSKNPEVGKQVFMALSSGDNKITGHLEKDSDIVAQIKEAVKDKDIVQNNTQTSDIKPTNKPALTASR